MRILALVHQPDAGPGIFGRAVLAGGHELAVWEPARGAQLPEPERFAAVMSFGGGMHPDQELLHPWLAQEKELLARALDHEVPLLAVCLGAELLAEAAGAPARRASVPEVGWYAVQATSAATEDPLVAGLPPCFEALEWHSYESPLPPGAVALARSQSCLQAYRLGERAWGIQFHAEVTLQTFESWLDGHREDPAAVELRIDPEALRMQTATRIHEWNRMGHNLCTRFLGIAAGQPGGVRQGSAG